MPLDRWRAVMVRRSLLGTFSFEQSAFVSSAKEYPLRILGLLYAMVAAELNEDQEASALLASELELREREHFPEAAVAIAAAALHRSGGWPLPDHVRSSIPVGMLTVIESLLQGDRPTEVRLEPDEDPVTAAVRTVAACWSWYVDGDTVAARELARQHCVRMSLFRLENGLDG